MTKALRVGTSICDSALRISSRTMTHPRLCMNGIRINSTLDGRCVNTMVLTRPKRCAMRTATRYEPADSTPVQKKIEPAMAVDSWKFWNSHSASIDWTMRPPANASRLNSAANRYTSLRDAPNAGLAVPSLLASGAITGGNLRYRPAAVAPRTAYRTNMPFKADSNGTPVRAANHSGNPAHKAPMAPTSAPTRL